MVGEAAGLERTNFPGPRWWVLDDGRDLPTVAQVSEGGAFDWSELHAVLAQVPAGRWTTYGDLAAVVGTAPMPLGGHIMTCPICPSAYRVLGTDGRPRPGFSWDDQADHRTQEQALAEEGVSFQNGVADRAQRMGVEELKRESSGAMADPSTPGE